VSGSLPEQIQPPRRSFDVLHAHDFKMAAALIFE
jgi:hypothetical protein